MVTQTKPQNDISVSDVLETFNCCYSLAFTVTKIKEIFNIGPNSNFHFGFVTKTKEKKTSKILLKDAASDCTIKCALANQNKTKHAPQTHCNNKQKSNDNLISSEHSTQPNAYELFFDVSNGMKEESIEIQSLILTVLN